jgi:diaminohydroxyphosphoribosylaminopyrimidine deaminase / 5-amino-6-(5-phosphoribosylamino)uracil reductase
MPPRKTSFSPSDLRYMQQALEQARKGLGHTHPNPAVGAVIVKGKRVVAVGYHRKAGKPHAEAEALAAAKQDARGATLYVTLEPCCHTGRTGPCTEAIISAGIRKVVIGCRDANPMVDGGGIEALKKAGIAVQVGCMEAECFELNRAFFCWIQKQRPLVTLKFASTMDGVIGQFREPNAPAQPLFITGKESLAYAHELRAMHSAILVGQGTIQADDPQLTVRVKKVPSGGSRDLLRVVLDSKLRTPITAKVVSTITDTTAKLPTLLVTLEPTRKNRPEFLRRKQALEAAGAEVVIVSADQTQAIDLNETLQLLAQRGVQTLLVEGGSTVNGSFITWGLVDQLVAFFAPKLAGAGLGVPITDGLGRGLTAALPLEQLRPRILGSDLVVEARVSRPAVQAQNPRRPAQN